MISSRSQRAGHDGDVIFRRMLGFSAIIHIFLLGYFVSATHVPAPKWTFGPVYSVQLVSLSDQMLKGVSSSISREILQPQPSHSAIILRKTPETKDAAPLKKADIQKTMPSGIEKALDAIRSKIQSMPKQPPAASGPTAKTERPSGQSDVTGNMDPYYTEIWAKIRGHWAMPAGILPKRQIETVINARILRNGAVVDVGFERRSGNRYFDESAERAVKKASPLPPLPPWVRGESIEIGIRFRSSELL
jgi:TonB family protein